MRKYIKNNLLELCSSMLLLHEEIVKTRDADTLLYYLEMCQEAAMAVGTELEELGDYSSIINNLEEYCERIFELSKVEIINQSEIEEVNCLIYIVKEFINKIPCIYHVVFLPYQISMWDCMESVWEEFKEDDKFVTSIVPIPYYTPNKKEGKWEYNYHGDEFKKRFEIIHYDNYSLEEMQPDIAVIHNAFDDRNYVTRVHQNYFTYNLKKYVDKLVYIPYYLKSGRINKTSCYLYNNIDYVIMQSEYIKELHKGLPNYDKMIPLGSPKLDRVTKISDEYREPQSMWREMIGNKKTVMLNTTIARVLVKNERLLDKLKMFFRYIKENTDDIAVIWRPHPLLMNTLLSMRVGLVDKYNELVRYFIDNEIGILDTTSCIEDTIGISDAYIGDAGSSVVNLFNAAGKPVFVLDELIQEEFTEKQKKEFGIGFIEEINGTFYTTTYDYQGLYKFKINNGYLETNEFNIEVSDVLLFKDEFHRSSNNVCIGTDKEVIYMSPINGKTFGIYNIQTNRLEYIGTSEEEIKCSDIISYKNKVFYLSMDNGYIYILDKITKRISGNESVLREYRKERKFADCGAYNSFAVDGNNIWLCAMHTDKLLKFNMDNETYEIISIGNIDSGFTSIVKCKHEIYLAKEHTGDIIKYNIRTNRSSKYNMPKEYLPRKNCLGQGVAQILYSLGKYIIGIPMYSNLIIRLNKFTGQIEFMHRDLLQEYLIEGNGYAVDGAGIFKFSKPLDEEHLMLQFSKDNKVIILNIYSMKYDELSIQVDEETYSKVYSSLIGEYRGFNKAGEMEPFCRRETKFLSIGAFLDDLVNDRLEKIKLKSAEEMKKLVENSDGRCGRKIYELLKFKVME